MYPLAGEHAFTGGTDGAQTHGDNSSPHSHISSPYGMQDIFSGEDGLSCLSTDILLHVAAHAKGPNSGAIVL